MQPKSVWAQAHPDPHSLPGQWCSEQTMFFVPKKGGGECQVRDGPTLAMGDQESLDQVRPWYMVKPSKRK